MKKYKDDSDGKYYKENEEIDANTFETYFKTLKIIWTKKFMK